MSVKEIKEIIKMLDEEFRLLYKLINEYYKDTEDAKDGTVDLEMSFEEWSIIYIKELIHDLWYFPSEGWFKKEIRSSIKEYIERLM